MKPYFRNQSHVEEDIQEFIEATFTHFDDEYDHAMKEIIWTIEFLLSNPSVSINEEVEELKEHLSQMHYPHPPFMGAYSNNLFCLYFHNILRQLPEVHEVTEGQSVSDHFEEIYGDELPDRFEEMYEDELPEEVKRKIACPSIKDYFKDKYENELWDFMTDFPDDWLFPFEDPDLLEEDNFEDEFTSFLRTLCKGCGQKFKSNSILKHLEHPDVKCSQYYEYIEMKHLNSKVPKSKILQGSIDTEREIKQRQHIKYVTDKIEYHFRMKGVDRPTIWFSENRDMTYILDNHDVPEHLIEKHKEVIKNAHKMYDKLDEEYENVKSQVFYELGPSDTWAKENSQLDGYFIKVMAENLSIYTRNEETKIQFILWDSVQDIANEIGANLDELKKPTRFYNSVLHDRFVDKYQNILRENLDRHVTTKQKMVDCFRRMEMWKGNLASYDVRTQGRHTPSSINKLKSQSQQEGI